MPGIQIDSSSPRDQNLLPTLAQPLPQLATHVELGKEEGEKYEVIVSGAGPAGSFLHLLLTRYGLKSDSLLCIDAKPATLKSRQADGLHSRTLEVFKTLNIVDEIMNDGCHFHEHTIWNVPPGAGGSGIQRAMIAPMVLTPARFAQTVTIYQGRVERIFEEDLERYSGRKVERSSSLIDVQLDEELDSAYPVVATIEHKGQQRKVRAKHLIGADGAHSVVRRSMGVKMEGDSTDDIWGVIDFVADTDFPDIRRMGGIQASTGGILLIPRERVASGDYLTRLYVSTPKIASQKAQNGDLTNGKDQVHHSQNGRSHVTPESILQQAAEIFHPYKIGLKPGTEIEWMTAYQVGQRVADRFVQKDSKGIPRVFIVGDACHTHSPKAGQGMNVSMMDSYDLSWKLMYLLNGLSPDPIGLLDTYEIDRRHNALTLIDFDKRWYADRYNNPDKPPSLSISEEFGAFFSGCGIEYKENLLVERNEASPITGTGYYSGVLREGRRLFSVPTIRFADGCPLHLHDDFPSDGRFRILALASTDLLNKHGVSATTLSSLCTKLLPKFHPGLLGLVILHPLDGHSFQWTDIPACVKQTAEMRLYNAPAAAYTSYGVDQSQGALVVVRPDGFVGTIAQLDDVDRVENYVRRVLKVL